MVRLNDSLNATPKSKRTLLAKETGSALKMKEFSIPGKQMKLISCFNFS